MYECNPQNTAVIGINNSICIVLYCIVLYGIVLVIYSVCV